ncbi:MAG: hypothetical protein UT12_C0001G0041 [Candidatus Curtissbacteria bacterium GW2011_GWC2_38_9]|uniref:Uncharacterized protein n=3 Tax=Candidatus Curtissiibacteriota TaxID=1752717 RepID=A0A1F5HQN9_9BACT|nr:MAG: hypothetical protein UT12_C0001G0041 [Candidatus Curtissbacteria bacterium GW2011_GWC2_38_9]KKS03532.1 MAG: hypothetical protein UU56_C0019G0010 [Candidatus Curtissbacteria bacterium GW2011_GWA2_41_24]OGE06454.1 MAG: hypothetical protein A2W70_01150 [Candidatus Curtissbacteria bacterium RIFCSPLOWO2_02_41_11]
MNINDLKALVHFIMPSVNSNKNLTVKDLVFWIIRIAVGLFVLWFVVYVLNFHFSIGFGR